MRFLLLLPITCFATGCQSYNWRVDYAKAEEDAKKSNKYLFVFYKSWLDDDSNRMLSNEVLSDPKVVAEFQDTINLLIERAAGTAYVEYMQKYRVDTFPAAVLVAPDGTYQTQLGFVPKDRFLEFVHKARGATNGKTVNGPPKR